VSFFAGEHGPANVGGGSLTLRGGGASGIRDMGSTWTGGARGTGEFPQSTQSHVAQHTSA